MNLGHSEYNYPGWYLARTLELAILNLRKMLAMFIYFLLLL